MILYTILIILLYIPVKLLLPTKIIGKKNLPKKSAYILCPNHYSWKDIFVLSIGLWGYRRIVAKKEIGNIFLAKIVIRGIGSILIDREGSDLKSIRDCISALKKGYALVIYPEGTRNRTDSLELQEIKPGAALIAIKGGVPIVPAIMYNRPRFFRKNYIYVDEPKTLEIGEGRLNSEKLAAATEEMTRVMNEAREKMAEFLGRKR